MNAQTLLADTIKKFNIVYIADYYPYIDFDEPHLNLIGVNASNELVYLGAVGYCEGGGLSVFDAHYDAVEAIHNLNLPLGDLDELLPFATLQDAIKAADAVTKYIKLNY